MALIPWLKTLWPWHAGGDEFAARSRIAWAEVAKSLRLRHTTGATWVEDTLAGEVQGIQVCVSVYFDFDLQKPVTSISLLPADSGTVLTQMSTPEVLAAFDQLADSAGDSAEHLLAAEERAWLAGWRLGVGISVEAGRLVYRQLYEMDDPAAISLVLHAMIKVCKVLFAR